MSGDQPPPKRECNLSSSVGISRGGQSELITHLLLLVVKEN